MDRQRIYELLEPPQDGDPAGRLVGFGLSCLIVANVVAAILETVKEIEEAAPAFFEWFEIISVAIFTAEYLLRLGVCTVNPRYQHPVLGRVRFALTPLALVDLAAILPAFLPFLGVDLRMIRLFRLFRLLRLAKLGRYSTSLQLLSRVLSKKRTELTAAASLLFLLLIVASAAIYLAERGEQPENFSSIPASAWWTVVTLTTVGYGDVYPITVLGRFFAGIIAVLGIGLFALPTGILAVGFLEEIQRKETCPHCGKEL